MRWRGWFAPMLLLAGCARVVRPPAQDPLIRVAVGLQEPVVQIQAPDGLMIEMAGRVMRGGEKVVLKAPDRMSVADGQEVVASLPLTIRSPSGEVRINQIDYRGWVEVREGANGFLVLNIVRLEDYLRSVVPAELGRVGAEVFEAAKAMAVAARSYALARLGRRPGFDLYSTVQDQLYPGKSRETELTTKAVLETRGLAVTYKGRVAETKYHSTCGGYAAPGGKVWSDADLPYLRAQPDTPGRRVGREPFCRGSPHFQWQRIYPAQRFAAGMSELVAQSYGLNSQPRVSEIRIRRDRRNPRPGIVEVSTPLGRFELSTTQLRRFFSLPSDYFELTAHSDTILLKGWGLGHGVGMCQWGALEMARRGYNFKQILFHYYPGTRLTRQY